MEKLAIMGGDPVISYQMPDVNDKSGRTFGQEELIQVQEVIETGRLGFISGIKIKQLQEKWARDHDVETAVCVSSGTAALHTAMNFLNIGPDDEVLVPAISDMGTVLGVMLQGAVPVFVDVDPITQNIDPGDIERHITIRTKAIIPVHLYGYPCDMDRIIPLAKLYELYVVEDCAQAHTTLYKGKMVGTFGDVACYSFQQSKQMTTGDGGMVMAKRDNLCGRKLIHCHDKAWPRELYREHLFVAPNYHFTELQAAIGLAQYQKLDQMIYQRRTSALHLSRLLADISGVYPQGDTLFGTHTFWGYDLPLNMDQFTVDSKMLTLALQAEGLLCFPGYLPKPLYMYDVVSKKYNLHQDLCPNAVKACESMLFIPWTEKHTIAHAKDISTAVHKVLDYYHK